MFNIPPLLSSVLSVCPSAGFLSPRCGVTLTLTLARLPPDSDLLHRRQREVVLVQSVFARSDPVDYDDAKEMWKVVRPGDVMEKR